MRSRFLKSNSKLWISLKWLVAFVYDWLLLERIAQSDKPIIASTAGADIDLIDNVTAFLSNRDKEFALMHCVGEYPTADEKMHVGQIGFLKSLPWCEDRSSTHEAPDNTEIIKLAVALGAEIHEKHVALGNKTIFAKRIFRNSKPVLRLVGSSSMGEGFGWVRPSKKAKKYR